MKPLLTLIAGGGGGGSASISNGTTVGDFLLVSLLRNLWHNTGEGRLFIYYQDANLY